MPNFSAGATQKLRKTDGTDILVSFGTTPHVNISKTTDNYLFQGTDLLSRIDDVIFSSFWFNYLSVSDYSIQSGTVTLPQRNVVTVSSGKSSSHVKPYYGVYESLLYSHNRGYYPAFAAFDENLGRPLGGTQIYYNGTSHRFLSIAVSTTGIYLREAYGVGSSSLPQVSFSFKFLVFDQGIDEQYSYSGDPLLIEPNKVVFGGGKFNTDYNILYQNNSSNFRINQNAGIKNNTRSSLPFGVKIQIVEDSTVTFSVEGSTPSFSHNTNFEDPVCDGTTIGVSLP